VEASSPESHNGYLDLLRSIAQIEREETFDRRIKNTKKRSASSIISIDTRRGNEKKGQCTGGTTGGESIKKRCKVLKR